MKRPGWYFALTVVVVGLVSCTSPPTGRTVTTVAGTPGVSGSADGVGGAASFRKTYGVAVDSSGNVFVVDSDAPPNTANNTIRKITPAGVVTTFAGTAGVTGSADGVGAAASFNNPQGIAIDQFDNLYVADTMNQTIRKITPAAVVSTVAGKPGVDAHVDGSLTAARFYYPYGVAVDDASNVYVVGGDDTVRKITSTAVTTIAGSSKIEGTADGTGSAARFNEPWGVTSTGSGTLFVADQQNHTIRRVTYDGVVTTLAGAPGVAGSSDGTGNGATFHDPSGITLDGAGDLYVTDTDNYTVRKITQAGTVTTVAGTAGVSDSSDGVGSAARFFDPTGIADAPDGSLYVADSSNRTIRRIT